MLFRSTNASGVDRTLTASIRNTVWTMGTTVTYKLSITPEYEMNIEVPTEAQDAHYITFPITVNVKDYDGAWTLTSNLTNDVFFTQTKTELQEQGYWIDDDKGTNTISGTGSGNFTYHVYVTENIGDAARDLQFQITILIAFFSAPFSDAYRWTDIPMFWKAYTDGIRERLGRL